MAPDLESYDRIVVAFSGGKDSLAALLLLRDRGVDMRKVELWHHDVDGGGRLFMDWACTPDYCRAVARHLGVPIYFSQRDGGIEREMGRHGTPTAPVTTEAPGNKVLVVGGKGPAGTRGLFPQVSPDLRVRWCSAYVKIDVMDSAIRAQERFTVGRTLVITGERAEESANRARYATFEPHRADNRDGARSPRYIDHWRPIHDWSEVRVWAIIERHGIVPHVAYQLGWNRLSCMTCIFGSANQWATIRAVFSHRFEIIAQKEAATGRTIQRKASVRQLADAGTPYPAALSRPDLVAQANSHEWTLPIVTNAWTLPAGAFGENAGPT